MSFFAKLGVWIKNHMLFTIIIGVIVIVGITGGVVLLDDNITNLKSDSSSNNSSNDNLSDSSSINNNLLQDGTYSCELMYNGKSLDNDEVIRAWLQKLATYESSIDVDKINISDFRKNLFDEFGSPYIVKENNIVKLYLTNGSESAEYILYDINNNQFNAGKIWSDNENEKTLNTIETIFNKSIIIKQSKNSFTYGNFGFILIYPSIYNNSIKNGIAPDNVDIDYDKYTGLGDLVCNVSQN